MKAFVLFAVLAAAASLALAHQAGTRHGGFAGSGRTVEQWPGYVRVRQSHGGNTASITQRGTGSLRIDQD